MSTHILKEGQALCGIKGPPAAWPKDDTWVSFDDPRHLDEVDCWRCVCLHVGKPIPDEPKSPEHDKVKASNDLPQTLCEFVKEFLAEKDLILAKYHRHSQMCRDDASGGDLVCDTDEDDLLPAHQDIVALAAEFIGVDKKAYDAEKDAALKFIRELHALQEWAKTEGHGMLVTAGTSPRCNKTVRQRDPVPAVYLCDEEPGHGGKCYSKLLRVTS